MTTTISQNTLLLLLLSLAAAAAAASTTTPPPLPIPPLPSAAQLSWQLGEMALFLHFGPNTFTDSEWGTGHTPPSLFNPSALDATQWTRTAASAGFSRVILTAKHHDGFCLWPSALTDYSVGSSPWRSGSGDVVADLSAAARAAGLGLGLYLSPWDRHDASYGRTLDYNQFYLGQMTELLTRYGDVREVWLDGAKGEGEKDMEYFFETWFEVIHQHQPGAVIFSDAGPDVRWVGDEGGVAGLTSWSLFNRSNAAIGHTDEQQISGGLTTPQSSQIGSNIFLDSLGEERYSRGGDIHGIDWVPPECDVSIRPGWFWHSSESPKSALHLLDIYYNSVGRNCLLLLNVPPNSSGLISEEDIQVLQDFTALRQTIFTHNLAQDAIVTASSTRGGADNPQFDPSNVLREGIFTYWAPSEYQDSWAIFLDLGKSISFNVLQVQEPIQLGQRVINFHVDLLMAGEWMTVISGTTIGYKRLLKFPLVQTQFLRFIIDSSRADPLISYLGIYFDPFYTMNVVHNVSTPSSLNDSQPIKLPTYRYVGNGSTATI